MLHAWEDEFVYWNHMRYVDEDRGHGLLGLQLQQWVIGERNIAEAIAPIVHIALERVDRKFS